MAAKKPKDPNGVVTTLRYRLKDSSKMNRLDRLAGSVNFVVEEVGMDLGLKTSAVLSDGTVIENRSEFKKLEEKLLK
jgi:hypothetical protein